MKNFNVTKGTGKFKGQWMVNDDGSTGTSVGWWAYPTKAEADAFARRMRKQYTDMLRPRDFLVHVLVADDCEGYVLPNNEYNVGPLREAKQFTLAEARKYVKDCGRNTHLLTIVRITSKE